MKKVLAALMACGAIGGVAATPTQAFEQRICIEGTTLFTGGPGNTPVGKCHSKHFYVDYYTGDWAHGIYCEYPGICIRDLWVDSSSLL